MHCVQQRLIATRRSTPEYFSKKPVFLGGGGNVHDIVQTHQTYPGLPRQRWRKNRLQCLLAAAQMHIVGLVGFTVTATVSL